LTNTPAQGSEIDVILQGEDEQKLRQAGSQVLQALESRVTRASLLNDNFRERLARGCFQSFGQFTPCFFRHWLNITPTGRESDHSCGY